MPISPQTQANPIRNLWIISRFELTRLFRTPRGLLSLLTFAVVWYFILRYPVNFAAKLIPMKDFNDNISEMFGQIGLDKVLGWPVDEFSVYWMISLYLFPVFSILITADQTSSDRSRGTLRFLTLRTSRSSIYFGRFLGQMMIQTILIAGTLMATLAMAMYRDSDVFSGGFQSAIIMFINLFIVIMPFTALMALLSASVRSGKLSTMLAIVSWGVLSGFLAWLAYKLPETAFLQEWLPGAQRLDLVQTNGWSTLKQSLLPLIQTAIFLIAGQKIMVRSSI